MMGFCFDSEMVPKGQLIYRKRIGKLRIPRYRRSTQSRKTYFDDDGNPYYNDNVSNKNTKGRCYEKCFTVIPYQ